MPASKKRLTIFRGSDATPLGPEVMVTAPMDGAMQARLARLAGAGVKAGLGEKNLVLFREPGEQGMSLVYVWFKSGYPLPPHSHDVDCLYYVLAGELLIGGQTLQPGDGMFVPAGTGYTYEAGANGVEVLEFRNATRFNIALKGTDQLWDNITAVFRSRAAAWQAETIPPSKRK